MSAVSSTVMGASSRAEVSDGHEPVRRGRGTGPAAVPVSRTYDGPGPVGRVQRPCGFRGVPGVSDPVRRAETATNWREVPTGQWDERLWPIPGVVNRFARGSIPVHWRPA
ncbi:hypothetical protein GCM10027273_12340 [Nocardioides pakistanensis]